MIKILAELANNEEYRPTEGNEEIFKIISSDELVNFYCVKCKKIMTFNQRYGKHLLIKNSIGNISIYKFHSINIKDNEIAYKETEYSSDENKIEFSEKNEYYFIHSFICPQSNCFNSILQMFLFKDGKVKKIFQNYDDEMVNLKYLKEFDKLKFLNEQDTKEIYNADKLHQQGYHIASYVYLRRVVENIFNNLYEQNKTAIIIKGQQSFEKMYVKDKLDLLKPYLPELISPIESKTKYSQIYKILSEGIHNLDENTAANYYKLLKQIVIMILEKIKDNKKNENNVRALEKAYDNIFNEKNK